MSGISVLSGQGMLRAGAVGRWRESCADIVRLLSLLVPLNILRAFLQNCSECRFAPVELVALVAREGRNREVRGQEKEMRATVMHHTVQISGTSWTPWRNPRRFPTFAGWREGRLGMLGFARDFGPKSHDFGCSVSPNVRKLCAVLLGP